jgi:2,4-dienoyl-CoA reductase-like NADH-dependent reductase (Old Yellow Enzyme family)
LAIDNRDEVRQLFDEGMFDMIAIGPALTSNPEWSLMAQAAAPFLPCDKTTFRRLV